MWTYLKGKCPLVWVNTHEEERFIRELVQKNAGVAAGYKIYVWSAYRGVVPYDKLGQLEPNPAWEKTQQPMNAIEAFMREKITGKSCQGHILIMKDLHHYMIPPIPRCLRDLAPFLGAASKTLVVTAPGLSHGSAGTKPGIEPTLEKIFPIVDFRMPEKDLIRLNIQVALDDIKIAKETKKESKEFEVIKDWKVDYSPQEIEEITSTLQGLTETEIQNALYTCIKNEGKLDLGFLLSQKRQIIRRGEILEYINVLPTFAEVGGCDRLKKYVSMYKEQFSPEAEKFQVEPIRGILTVGIPGCGKSLGAKALATEWKLPLLRLDVGKVMSGLVGSSEQKMRGAIDQVEAVAPCVLWIDEIEKSLSGTKSSNRSDGGTLARVFGTLLTAMEERMKGVVIYATANDISALPPELIRRFSEVFFIDLPTEQEREEILRIHMTKKGRDVDELGINVEEFLQSSKDYTGSEIEKVVKEGIIRAFIDGRRPVETKDIISALEDTKPLSQVMDKSIRSIRKWAKNRARFASSLAEENLSGSQVIVDTSINSRLSDFTGEN